MYFLDLKNQGSANFHGDSIMVVQTDGPESAEKSGLSVTDTHSSRSRLFMFS